MPAPSSMPGSKGFHRTTSGPVADHRVRRHNKMRSLHARPGSSNHGQSKTLSPELAALLGRTSKSGKDKDKESMPRDKESARDGQLSARTAGTNDSSARGQVWRRLRTVLLLFVDCSSFCSCSSFPSCRRCFVLLQLYPPATYWAGQICPGVSMMENL